MTTSWTPNPLTVRWERSTTRRGVSSGCKAANLLGTTRTSQLPLPGAATRNTSGGVDFSLPGQKGHLGSKLGRLRGARSTTMSLGRLARSVAIMTHSLVKRF